MLRLPRFSFLISIHLKDLSICQFEFLILSTLRNKSKLMSSSHKLESQDKQDKYKIEQIFKIFSNNQLSTEYCNILKFEREGGGGLAASF